MYTLIVGIAFAAVYSEPEPIADDLGLTLLRLILMLNCDYSVLDPGVWDLAPEPAKM